MIQETCIITKNIEIAKNVFEMTFYSDALVGLEVNAGQFAHIKVPDKSKQLRRPISINSFDVKKGEITIVYQAVGEGTQILSRAEAGTELDVVLPLGNGFTVEGNGKNILLVGGGIGIAPLRYIPEQYPDHTYYAALGWRGAENVYQLDIFNILCKEVAVATEDGSVGAKGFVTGAVQALTEKHHIDVVLACGPIPMLKAIQAVCAEKGIPSQLSLEERMGCGIGACLVCNCAVKTTDDSVAYKRVCADGPVFNGTEVVL